MKVQKILSLDVLLIVIAVVLSVLFRLHVVSDNNILFWYDQGRDFSVVSDMLGGDTKIFGPTASGTKDTVYHGVLYYYLLLPLIYIFNGNIQLVSYGLAFFSSIAIIPIYLLGKKITQSRFFAFILSILFATSFEAAQMSTWLSNPMIMMVTLPFFYYSFWLTFIEKKYHYLPMVALFLGLSNQSTIHTIYLFVTVAIGYWYAVNQEKNYRIFSPLQVISAVLIYLLSISTMLISQVRLMLAGIYPTLDVFVGPPTISGKLTSWVNMYGSLAGWTLFPAISMFSILVVAVVCYWFFSQKRTPTTFFLSIWLLSPLALLSLQERQNYHFLIGLSVALLIIFTMFLARINKFLLGNILVGSFLMLYVVTQVFASQQLRMKKVHITNDQQEGALLADQYALIDRSYNLANGQPFTISMFTTPYGLYSTWTYLFSQYGAKKYGYLPKYVGFDQDGIVGAQYLQKTDHPAMYHFSIYEPVVIDNMPKELVYEFVQLQNSQTGVNANEVITEKFGTLVLEIRKK